MPDEKKKMLWLFSGNYKKVDFIPDRTKVGDILVTKKAFPKGNVIFWKDFKEKKGYRFSIRNLKEYLKLLELIVLNERVIIGSFLGFKTPITGYEYEIKGVRDAIVNSTGGFELTPELSLYNNQGNEIKDSGIIFEAMVHDEELLSPVDVVKRYLKIDSLLKNNYESYIIKTKRRYNMYNDLAEKIAFSLMALKYGVPNYMSEFCRSSGIAYWMSESEEKALSNQVHMEKLVTKNTIGMLKESLDIGASKQLEKLREVGVRTVFPESPIASVIIREANRPEDINKIALQLREDFRKIRSSMVEIQKEILKDETSIKRKMALLKEIEMLCCEIWPQETEGWRMILNPLSGLLNIVVGCQNLPSVNSVKDMVDYVVRQPYEIITKALRRNKIKVILEAKSKFLKSTGWSDKIAKIFGLKIEDVTHEQIKYEKNVERWEYLDREDIMDMIEELAYEHEIKGSNKSTLATG